MIQPLRAIHRRASVVLAFLIPATLVIGLMSRRAPTRGSIPAISLPVSLQLLQSSAAHWQKLPLETALYGDLNPPNDFFVVISSATPVNEPGLLIYWTKSQPDPTQLPPQAQLLGPFVPGQPVAMPPQVEPGSHLIAYSLAHQKVVDSATLEPLP